MRILVTAVTVLALCGVASATPVDGQSVIYRYDSTHSYTATVAKANGDGSADLVIFNFGTYSFSFGPGSFAAWPATYLAGVVEGNTDNRWHANASIGLGEQGPQGDTGSTGATGTTGATGAAGATGPGALVTATSTPSFALGGSAIQLDSAHDTELTMSVSVSLPLSLLAGATGTVHLFCDSSSTPTTEVVTVLRGNTGGLVTTDTSTLLVKYRVPAAHYCKATATQDVGLPTFAIARQVKQVLGN